MTYFIRQLRFSHTVPIKHSIGSNTFCTITANKYMSSCPSSFTCHRFGRNLHNSERVKNIHIIYS